MPAAAHADCLPFLTTDAQLAAIAADNNATMCSNDTDFARFGDIRWHNPLTA